MKGIRRSTIRGIALSATVPLLSFLLVSLLELSLDIEISKLQAAVINMIVVIPFAFLLSPNHHVLAWHWFLLAAKWLETRLLRIVLSLLHIIWNVGRFRA